MAFYWDHDDQAYSDRDAPLIFGYSAPDLVERLGLRVDGADSALVVSTILANLGMAAEAGKALSYSRHKGFYAPNRYRAHAFNNYDRMMAGAALIVNAGLALEDRTQPGHRGRQSTLTATPALNQVWFGMNADPVYAPGESIILKSRATKDLDARLIDYRTTRMTNDLRKGVMPINEMFADTTFDVPAGKQIGRNLLLFEKQGIDDDGNPTLKRHYVRTTPDNGGRRIFTGNFSGHGRFYCSLQNVPSEARLSMLINGEPVIETDIKALHPTLLYNLAGVKMDGDDPYVVPGYPRKHIKLAFVIHHQRRDLCKRGGGPGSKAEDGLAICARRHRGDTASPQADRAVLLRRHGHPPHEHRFPHIDGRHRSHGRQGHPRPAGARFLGGAGPPYRPGRSPDSGAL